MYPFRSAIYVAVASISINLVGADPADALFPILMVWGITVGALRRSAFSLPASLVGFGALLAAAYVVSAVVGGYRDSWVAVLAANVLFCLFLMAYVTSAHRMRVVLVAAVYGLVLSGVLAALSMVVEYRPAWMFEVVRHDRFMALSGDPNVLALYCAFFVVWLIDEARTPRLLRGGRWLPTLLLAAVAVQVVLTQSRSGWAGVAVSCLTYWWLNRRALSPVQWVRLGLASVVVGAAVLGIVTSLGMDEVLAGRGRSFIEHESMQEEERFGFRYTKAALDVGLANPLGVGPGMTIAATGIENLDGDPIGAHNALVQIWADNGVVAAASALAIAAILCRRVWKKAVRNVSVLGLSSRVVFSALMGLAAVGLGHDLVQWRMAWLTPALALVVVARAAGSSVTTQEVAGTPVSARSDSLRRSSE